MKKLLYIFIALTLNIFTASAQDYLENLANKFCDCYSTATDNGNDDSDSVEIAFEKCVFMGMKPYQEQIIKDFNYNINHRNYQSKNFTELYKKINYISSAICLPGAIRFFETIFEKELVSVHLNVCEGIITEVIEESIITFKVKDYQGKMHDIVWLTEVKSNKPLPKYYKKLLNSPVVISFVNTKVFHPRKNKYEVQKVMTKISF